MAMDRRREAKKKDTKGINGKNADIVVFIFLNLNVLFYVPK